MLFRHWFLQFSFLLILTACGLEKAKGPLHPEVQIASDCLYPKDTILFDKFKKTTGISVRIKHETADRILSDLRRDKLLTDFDFIVLHGTSAIQFTETSTLFMSIPRDSIPKELSRNYVSKERKIIGLGFDPFILVTSQPSVSIRPTYASLYDSLIWCSDLSETSEWSAYADFLKNSPTLNGKNPRLNCVKLLRENDTLRYADVLFTKHSNFLKKKKRSLKNFRNGTVLFPDQKRGGYAYDMPVCMIVNQAYNYSNACRLLHYLIDNDGNKFVNRALGTFPLHSGKKLKRSKRSPIQRIK